MRSPILKLTFAATLIVGCLDLRAVEKRWVAHEAQAIVVGTFRPNSTLPWFDGWHIDGTITVDEILYGGHLPHQIHFRFVCAWEHHCQWWPPPHYPSLTFQKGIWFLRRFDENTWESADGFSGTGFRYLKDRAYWENYIRLYKR